MNRLNRSTKAVFLLLLCTRICTAQTKLPVPANIQKAYAAATRSLDGAPGQHYWQNAEDYQIKVSFDPVTLQIDSGAFFIAYFFPRIAVYDDIDGWNQYPYTGQYEFYNDFCHFNTEITVPADYQVWATGDLKDPDQVYTPKFADRIRRAGQSDTVI